MMTGVAALLISVAGPAIAPAGGQQTPSAMPACETIDLPGVTWAERRTVPATAGTRGQPSLPPHCELIGEVDRRVGADGQRYAIRFHLRLPQRWNRRFFFQGGGGSNGVLGDALGNLQGEQTDVALMQGFAVVSQDSGHDNAVNNRSDRGGVVSFGWDATARRNYAYASQARVTEVAKALIASVYGEQPEFSYFVGCSKGGQEGMAMAERYPGYFDGIMANAPGFALPRAAIAQAFDTGRFARLAARGGLRGAGGSPLINASFSDSDLGLVSAAVLEACDGLDGAKDGIVADTVRCSATRVRPALTARRCAGTKTSACLSPAQVSTITDVMAGGRGAGGQPLYSDWPWDPGIGGTIGGMTFNGWRAWKLGTAVAAQNDARNIVLGGSSLASVFTTPPTPQDDKPAAALRYQLSLDLNAAERSILRTSADFPESSWSSMSARSANRDAFRRAGGRMIVVHGAADPVFSLRDTMRWWQRLDARYKGQAADFTRLFAVPGMNHCRGGPATSSFDAFTALTRWVEQDVAPDRIIATAPPGTPWPGRTRPLCAFPKVARYAGAGNVEQASNFTCS